MVDDLTCCRKCVGSKKSQPETELDSDCESSNQNRGTVLNNIKMGEYFVTGGTSFIASHVVKALLDLGHSVRTTVRDSSGTFRSLIYVLLLRVLFLTIL